MLIKLFFMVFFALIATGVLSGCSPQENTRPTPVVEVQAPVNVQKVLIVPDKVLEDCKPLPTLTGGSRGDVLKWAIDAHGKHGLCGFKKELSDDFLRAAANTGSKVELYGDGLP